MLDCKVPRLFIAAVLASTVFATKYGLAADGLEKNAIEKDVNTLLLDVVISKDGNLVIDGSVAETRMMKRLSTGEDWCWADPCPLNKGASEKTPAGNRWVYHRRPIDANEQFGSTDLWIEGPATGRIIPTKTDKLSLEVGVERMENGRNLWHLHVRAHGPNANSIQDVTLCQGGRRRTGCWVKCEVK